MDLVENFKSYQQLKQSFGRHLILLGLLSLMLTSSVGCNLLAYPAYIIAGGGEKKVKAAYKGLNNQTIAILIAADPDVEARYPQSATAISLGISRFIGEHVENTRFIASDLIDAYKMKNLEWYTLPMGQVGRDLKADRILYLDLYQYDMYEPGSIQLLHGQIAATLKVYEINSNRPDSPVCKLPVQAEYPSGAPVAASDTALWSVTQKTTLLFADNVAKKFYDHKVNNSK